MTSRSDVKGQSKSELKVVTRNNRESEQKRKSVFGKLKSRIGKICRFLCRCCQCGRCKSKADDGQTLPQSKLKGYITERIPGKTRIRAEKLLSRLESHDIVLGEFVGRGGYGYVVEAMYKNQKKIAVKIVDLKKRALKFNEIDSRKQLKHENIIDLVMGFVKNDIKIVVMPFASTDLFYYIKRKAIIDKELLSEKEVRHIFVQIISGIGHMHKNGLAHRDLKLDNILITDPQNMVIKVSDFDLTRKVFDRNGQLIKSFSISCMYFIKLFKSQLFNVF